MTATNSPLRAALDAVLTRGSAFRLLRPDRDDAGRDPRDEWWHGVATLWWWANHRRAVVLHGGGAVVVEAPQRVDRRPLRLHDASRVVLIGQSGVHPGDVEVAADTSIGLERTETARRPPAPAVSPEIPDPLARLYGQQVEVRNDGGEESGPVYRGQVFAAGMSPYALAVVVGGYVVIVQDPRVVALEPETAAGTVGPAAIIRGALDRVVVVRGDGDPAVHRWPEMRLAPAP